MDDRETIDGAPITEDQIDRWAAEAEAGIRCSDSETAAAPAQSADGDGATRVASWQLVSSSDDGSTLTIGVAVGGGCERIERVDVAESESSVTITPILLTGLAEACADSVAIEDRAVTLQSPLGERTLVHDD